MTRQRGTLTEWNDARGFGFITPAGTGRRVFAHVSAFAHGRRPAVGDDVEYDLGTDDRGRPRALRAGPVGHAPGAGRARAHRTPRSGRSRRGTGPALVVAGTFLAAVAGLVALGLVPTLLLAAYGVLSLVAFLLYRADKAAAGSGRWRTPEANLHAVALLGGWPGALVARRALRHKTRKQPFRTVFWGTVLANCGALVWVAAGMPLGG